MKKNIVHCILFISVVFHLSFPSYQQADQTALALYDLGAAQVTSVTLSHKLREISGLAMTEDGRLFAHDDNVGIVYQLDPLSGKIVKSFSLGRPTVHHDFEDIAIVGDRFFLIASNGVLYEFHEGSDGGSVPFTTFLTGLSARNNVEGLCYDSETRSLLLACKEYPGKGYDGFRAIYSFSLKTMSRNEKPRFLLSRKAIESSSHNHQFKPSGIVRHPTTGTFLILASKGLSIVEVSASGELLKQVRLTESVHRQPEGICVAPDGSLLISDEGTSRGQLSRYPVLTVRSR